MSAARTLALGLTEIFRLDEPAPGPYAGLLGHFSLQAVGAGVTSVPGKFGQAAHFDGASALQCPQVSVFSPQQGDGVGVACWVKIAAVPGTGNFPRVVCLEGVFASWLLYLNETGGVGWEVWDQHAASFGPAESSALSLNAWHLLVGSYDRANVQLWVDGALVGSAPFAGDLRRTSTPLQVGRRLDFDGVTGVNYLTGSVDALLLNHRGFTVLEVAALWNGGAGDRLGSELPGRRAGLAPIVSVSRTLDYPSPGPGVAVEASELRAGPHLERFRTVSSQLVSDVMTGVVGQVSLDDGRNYGPPFALPGSLDTPPFNSGPGPMIYDPASGLLVRQWEQLYVTGSRFFFHTQWQTSDTNGRTWGPLSPFLYEAGSAFDPLNPVAAGWLNNNQLAYGNNIWRKANGDLLVAAGSARDPVNPNATPDWMNGGLLFTGHWTGSTYVWTPSNLVSIPSNPSGRGLLEPVAAELLDGRVIVISRTDIPGGPGLKYISVSTDGGATLSTPVPLTWDTGGQMWSPSASPYLYRSPVTGKLYHLGNASVVASGDVDRWPFVIVEVDETASPPVLKRDTLTVIDDRTVTQPREIQFSNAAMLEDIDPQLLWLQMTLEGAYAPADVQKGDHYQYRVVTPRPGRLPAPTAADYVFLQRAGSETWNRAAGAFQPFDAARREEFAIGVTPAGAAAVGVLPPVGAAALTVLPFTLLGLAPSGGDTALPAATLPASVAVPDPPKGSASVSLGPAGTASVGSG